MPSIVPVAPKAAIALLSGFLLSACMAPIGGTPQRPAPPPATTPPAETSMPQDAAPTPGDTSVTAAEQSCMGAGRERGLDVIGIAGSREVAGATGAPARDVMLRVNRGGAQIEVRCNYQSDTGLARIMLI